MKSISSLAKVRTALAAVFIAVTVHFTQSRDLLVDFTRPVVMSTLRPISSKLPARITAVLLAIAGGGRGLARLRTEARCTPSPNSGWPMSAMALALNVRLAKPGVYTLHSKGRRAGPLDTRRAARLGTQVVLAMVPVVAGLQLLVLVVFAWAHT